MDYAAIIDELKAEISEASAALRYFEKKLGEGHRTNGIRQEVSRAAAKPAVQNQSIPGMILGLLNADPERDFSVPEIISAIDANDKSVRGAINRMATEGEITRVDRGMYRAKAGAKPLDDLFEKGT